jgi:hypothetical protein
MLPAYGGRKSTVVHLHMGVREAPLCNPNEGQMLASQLVQEDKQEHAGRSSGRLQSLLDALSGLLPNSVQKVVF